LRGRANTRKTGQKGDTRMQKGGVRGKEEPVGRRGPKGKRRSGIRDPSKGKLGNSVPSHWGRRGGGGSKGGGGGGGVDCSGVNGWRSGRCKGWWGGGAGGGGGYCAGVKAGGGLSGVC